MTMEYFWSIYQWAFILLVTTSIPCSRGASVSLTVEGGVSLVGPHCPRTVKLFCEGVGLISLRWRYNGNIIIVSYFPDGASNTQPTESAFVLTHQLTAVAQNPINPNLANFSSCLTVNLSQLQSNNITEISCSDPTVSKVEPVNVSIIEPSVPNSPTITMVIAAYQSGELNSVEVTWEKSDNFCLSFGLFFTYEVNLTIYNSVLVNHFSTSCGEESCMVSFKNLTGETEEYTVSIKAENELGSSDFVLYPFSIAHQIQQYFISEVFPKDRQLFGRCTAARTFAGSAVCIIQYTTDSMYRDLSNKTIQPLNTEFPLLEDPVSEITYYFQFSVLVSNTLQINERIVFKFSAQADTGVPSWRIALIVIAVIVFLTVPVLTVILSLFLISYRQTSVAGEDEEEHFTCQQ